MFNEYPYTDYHELNTDWIIGKIKNVETAEANTKQYAEDADAAKVAAQDAQTAAEDAQRLAENARDDAQDTASDIAGLKDSIDLLQARVDNIIPDGTQTAGNTELLDIRVAEDGRVYDSAGNAVRGQVSDLKSDLNASLQDSVKSFNIFDKNNLEHGAFDASGNRTADATFYRTRDYQPITGPHIIGNYTYNTVFYDEYYQFLSRQTSMQANTVYNVPAGAKYAKFYSYYTIVEAHINEFMICNRNALPYPYVPYHVNLNADYKVPQVDAGLAEYFTTRKNANIFNAPGAIPGTISSSGVESASSTSYITTEYETLTSYDIIGNYNYYVALYDANYDFISRTSVSANTVFTAPNTAVYVKFIVITSIFEAHTHDMMICNAAVLPSEYVPYKNVYLNADIEKNTDKLVVFGKQFLVYQFGGEGNDWCFVHTPPDYDPFRKKPYKFVICNHGNGTTMTGNPATANYTVRTMYVPEGTADPSYDQIETADSTLWYSNPTIEMFLNNDYIVCGCENYADALYGNEKCRQACVDFYNHIVSRYNVYDYCYMIGASNGAQTSINAAYYLQGKVRAMVLQYPLTCLINQYFAYPGHQAGIKAAYDITLPNPTLEEMIEATATHDVLHTNIINDIRVDVFPPVKLYYSNGDTVVIASANSIPLIQMLQDSNKIVESVVCTGNHGNVSHFDPAGFYDFISKF